jgi:hypothetical protein
MRPDCDYTVDIDLGCNPNLLTLSVENSSSTLYFLIRLLSGIVLPNLPQVNLYFEENCSFYEWDCWPEIDRILNGQASVHLVEIVLEADPRLGLK